MKFCWQFGMFLVVVGIAVILSALVSTPGFVLLGTGHTGLGYHLMQWSQTLVLMMLAPLCWYKWFHLPALRPGHAKWRDCLEEARLTTIDWRYMFVTFCLMLVALPAMDFLEVFMNRLPWPQSIQDYIESGFQQNQVAINHLLEGTNIFSYIEQFLLMCLCTAIGEELMFRGALYSCFRNVTRMNLHAIAWVIGFIFALIHFEPAGFMIRMLLGAFLVYLVFWSGSLWPSILAHCMNNSCALIGFHLSTPEERAGIVTEYTFGPVLTVCSFVATVVVLYVLWQMRKQKELR